jgi:hypothetical protein
VTREERQPGAFSAIALDGIGELVVVQGPEMGLAVETDDNLHAKEQP